MIMEKYSEKVQKTYKSREIEGYTDNAIIDCIKDAYGITMCGCGNNTLALDYIYKHLKNIEMWKDSHYEEYHKTFSSQEEMYFFQYWADTMRFTEHGCSINCGWLIQKGKDFIIDYEVFMQSEEYLD